VFLKILITHLKGGGNYSQKLFYLIQGIIGGKTTFLQYVSGDTGGGAPYMGGIPHARGVVMTE
jgi:hypothetical protein